MQTDPSSTTLAIARERVETALQGLFGDAVHELPDGFGWGVSTTGQTSSKPWAVMVTVHDWTEQHALVKVRALLLQDVPLSDELLLHVARLNDKLELGAITLDGNGMLWHSHSLIVTTIDQERLAAPMLWGLVAGDTLADELQRQWGGYRVGEQQADQVPGVSADRASAAADPASTAEAASPGPPPGGGQPVASTTGAPPLPPPEAPQLRDTGRGRKPVSEDTRTMAQVIVSPGGGPLRGARRKALDLILDAMDGDESLLVPGYEHGYCGGWDARVHPAGAKTKQGDVDTYLVTDRGLYVTFLEKTGLVSSATTCLFYPHALIESCSLRTSGSPDGSETYVLTLRGPGGENLVDLMFIFVAGFGFDNIQRANVLKLREALGFTR